MMRTSGILFFVTLTIACNQTQLSDELSPLDQLPENEAGDLVRKAIDYAGGWTSWSGKNDFSFYKKITQLDSAGATIRQVKQLHQYNLKPGFQARMSWDLEGAKMVIINNGEQAKKYQNGAELTDDKSRNEAWNSSYGSNYVVSMPFKLTDPGTILTYEGIDSTTLDQPVHALKVEYEKGAGSTGGMHDWWYYFDLENFDLVGNYLDYGNGHSLTTYESFINVDGLRIHQKRLSYSSNEQKEKVLLRTIYENEEMKFDNQFNPSVFKLL